jgi:hypothetical protein
VWRVVCTRSRLVTRFDRTWEPLVVVLAAAVIWFGTLI